MSEYILILAGPSGVGKTSVAEELCKRNSKFEMSRSHTTRAPRGDGRDSEYIYCSTEEFRLLQAGGELVESTEYAGTLYGTSRTELSRIVSEGKIPLLVLDYSGVLSMKSADVGIPVVSVYLYCALDTIEERLYSRMKTVGVNVDGLIAFEKRRRVNILDYLDINERMASFDFLVENGELSSCVSELLSLTAEIDKVKRQPEEFRKEIAGKLFADAKRKSEFCQ